ncbi:hypothetical protein BH11CYA1_BH11CYA1_28320 [soil metagenome]
MVDLFKAKIFSKVTAKRFLVGLSLSCLASGLVVTPAQAQFPYWYLGIGQSLLYPLTRGIGLPFYGPYSANPFYSTSSYLNRAAGRAMQFPYIYPYNPSSYAQYGYRNAGMPAGNATQQPGDGMIDPNTGRTLDPDDPRAQGQAGQTGSAPNFYLPGAQSQSLYGQPNQAALPPQSMQPMPMPGMPMPGMPAQTDANGQPVLLTEPTGMPPKAPKHGRHKSKSAKNSANSDSAFGSGATPPAVPAASQPYSPSALGSTTPLNGAGSGVSAKATASPLADGFIDHLVTKYDGNMGNALNNSDTRNWAKAMGVIDEQHDAASMPADRIEVMGRILKDSSLDSVSKVDAMRILLKQKPAAK